MENKSNEKKGNGTENKGLTWIPLGCGFSKEEKKGLEREFGSNWRDLFNGL